MIATDVVDAKALYRRISWRLLPYLFLLYIVAYLDRVKMLYPCQQYRSRHDIFMSNQSVTGLHPSDQVVTK